MTKLQEIRAAASAKWPDQKRNFEKCTLARVNHDIRGAMGLHAASGETLLTRSTGLDGLSLWATRTETWIFLSKREITALDDTGYPLEVV